MDAKRALTLVLIMILFHFYYTYFRVTLGAARRLEPWKRAIKRMF